MCQVLNHIPFHRRLISPIPSQPAIVCHQAISTTVIISKPSRGGVKMTFMFYLIAIICTLINCLSSHCITFDCFSPPSWTPISNNNSTSSNINNSYNNNNNNNNVTRNNKTALISNASYNTGNLSAILTSSIGCDKNQSFNIILTDIILFLFLSLSSTIIIITPSNRLTTVHNSTSSLNSQRSQSKTNNSHYDSNVAYSTNPPMTNALTSASYENGSSVMRKSPEGKDNDSFRMEDKLGGKDASHKYHETANKLIDQHQRIGNDISTEIFSASNDNGKINVQVTVLVGEFFLSFPFQFRSALNFFRLSWVPGVFFQLFFFLLFYVPWFFVFRYFHMFGFNFDYQFALKTHKTTHLYAHIWFQSFPSTCSNFYESQIRIIFTFHLFLGFSDVFILHFFCTFFICFVFYIGFWIMVTLAAQCNESAEEEKNEHSLEINRKCRRTQNAIWILAVLALSF